MKELNLQIGELDIRIVYKYSDSSFVLYKVIHEEKDITEIVSKDAIFEAFKTHLNKDILPCGIDDFANIFRPNYLL